ncbi:hypothetical protein A73_238 [Escherichia phage A73]|uniref:Uncharacterized protein n=1 Tax=Escherichia phage A73 TaxID=3003819 RepID=A0AAE9W592_9CAUD|nr:hypothetical protein A73_238 [Escherichia phage A73]WBF77968.1 hypothetical protein W70_223 [Escherichia phage W70]
MLDDKRLNLVYYLLPEQDREEYFTSKTPEGRTEDWNFYESVHPEKVREILMVCEKIDGELANSLIEYVKIKENLTKSGD